jgi:hypothetical protein
MTEKKAVWTILAIIAALVIALVLLLRAHRVRELADRLSVPIEGAVVQRDADPQNELPIPDVVITASDGTRSAATRSDASGYFKLVLHKRVLTDQPITVTFHHPRYEPLNLVVPTSRFETQPALRCRHNPDRSRPSECSISGFNSSGASAGNAGRKYSREVHD